MPKTQAVTRSAKGLFLQYNPIHQVPEGALLEADDVQIDREGVVSKRRGVERYGVTFNPDTIFEYEDTLVGFESGGTARYDVQGDGSEWRAYTGTFSPPDSSTSIHATEAQLNWYFTSSDGIMKTDSVSTDPIRAGIPTGLDLNLTNTGTGLSWFYVDTQVAYRIVWGRVDTNGVLLLGAPSFRRRSTNAGNGINSASISGTLVTVTATAHGLANADEVFIWNIDAAALALGWENSATTTAARGTFTVSNKTDDTFQYNQVGTGTGVPDPEKMNYGKDFNVALNFTIPSDMVENDFYDIYRSDLSPQATAEPDDRLKYVGRFVLTDTNITAGTITTTDNKFTTDKPLYTNAEVEGLIQQNSRPPFAKDLEIFRRHMFFFNTKKLHMLEMKLIDTSDITNDVSWFKVSDGTTELGYIFSGTENVSTHKVLKSTSEDTLAQNIAETMRSFCKVVNRDPSNDFFYAYYVSQEDEDPGRVVIESRTTSGDQLSIKVNTADTGSQFSPTIPIAHDLYVSDNSTYVNRLCRSKIDEFEAVPDQNYDEIGDTRKAGLRCLALRDSLVLLKEDGVFRLSGESERNFVVKQLDSTQQLKAPESAVVLDNAVWCLTEDGVVRISEAGTTIMSRQIEDELLKILTYTDFDTITHAVAYESENRYCLFTQGVSTDTTATVCWCFNLLTNAWTRWKISSNDALVQFTTDKMLMVHPTEEFLVRERKDFAATDFRDETFNITFSNVSTDTDEDDNTITTVDVVFSTREIISGWTFHNVPVNLPALPIIKVDNLGEDFYRLHLNTYVPALTAGDATLNVGIPSRVRWVPEAAGNLGVMKQFSFVQIYLENPVARCTFAAVSDFFGEETRLSVRDPTTVGSQVIRVPVPRDLQRGRSLSVAFEHGTAGEDFSVFQVSYTVRPYGERTSLVPR